MGQVLKDELIEKLNKAFPLAARVSLGNLLDDAIAGAFMEKNILPLNVEPGINLSDVILHRAQDFRGVWDASTNTPALTNNGVGGGNGDFFIVSVAGSTVIDGINTWRQRDWIINNGSTWERSPNIIGASAFTLTLRGVLGQADDQLSFIVENPFKLSQIRFSVSAANPPTGADAIIDIRKNGASIFNVPDRPKILAGQSTGLSGVPITTNFDIGDEVNIDVKQIGSTNPGGSHAYIGFIPV